MKKIGFYSAFSCLNQNRLFEDPSVSVYGDIVYPTHHLAQEGKKRGYVFSTIDTEPLDSFDAVFFLDFPRKRNRYYRTLVKSGFRNMYLVLVESEIIRPDNMDLRNHRHFRRILTWKDTLVDDERYIKIYLPNRIPKNPEFDAGKKDRFCTMIAGNKYTNHPRELYTERIRAIRWFEKNHLEDFDLYGVDWDRYCFRGPKPVRALNRIRILRKMLAPNYPSYRGVVKDKREVLDRYRFSICYENARNIPGYISEKIFDCFFSGCVPVYLGANNVKEYIPGNAFIDMRDYESYGEVYSYIKNMPEKEYAAYLEGIRQFLKSDAAYLFSGECYADTILNTLKEDLG